MTACLAPRGSPDLSPFRDDRRRWPRGFSPRGPSSPRRGVCTAQRLAAELLRKASRPRGENKRRRPLPRTRSSALGRDRILGPRGEPPTNILLHGASAKSSRRRPILLAAYFAEEQVTDWSVATRVWVLMSIFGTLPSSLFVYIFPARARTSYERPSSSARLLPCAVLRCQSVVECLRSGNDSSSSLSPCR